MALPDPITVTIAGVANTLPRVGSGESTGVWAKDDRTVVFKVSQQSSKVRNRRTSRMDSSKIAADPLLAGVNRESSMSTFFNFDDPIIGLSITEKKDHALAHIAALTANSNALLIKILGGES